MLEFFDQQVAATARHFPSPGAILTPGLGDHSGLQLLNDCATVLGLNESDAEVEFEDVTRMAIAVTPFLRSQMTFLTRRNESSAPRCEASLERLPHIVLVTSWGMLRSRLWPIFSQAPEL